MNSECAACKQTITTNRSVKCAACERNYHQICVNATILGEGNKQTDNWLCPACRPKTPHRESASVRPPSSTTAPSDSNLCSQSRAFKRIALGSPDAGEVDELDNTVTFADLVKEIRFMRSDIADIKVSLQLLNEGVDKCNARLDKYEQRIEALEQSSTDTAYLHNTISQLKDQLSQQSQAALRNEIEIIGIEETHNENLQHNVIVAAAKLGVKLINEDIDWTSRAGPKRPSNANHQANFPRPVIVKLLRRGKRDEMLKAFKSRRNLTSSDVGIAGPARKIYINEHLTKENRLLYRDARARAKDGGFRFCWTNSGRIYIRKEEGKPPTLIRSNKDLDFFLGPPPSQAT